MLAQGRSPTLFQVGDLVRINLLALSERMRELKEEGRVNKLAVYYTSEIYRVVRVILSPPNATIRTRYIVQDDNRNDVMRGRQPRLFFASELILQQPARAGLGPIAGSTFKHPPCDSCRRFPIGLCKWCWSGLYCFFCRLCRCFSFENSKKR